MIVFKEDWKKFPGAIVDVNTKNKSFIEIAQLLRAMGVEHWYFPLALHNPLLAGKSPYDEDLTFEERVMMLDEADANPWFYLREVATDYKAERIEDKRFKAHRGNIAAMWLICACINYLQIAPRQTGKSFGADCNTNWLMYYKCSGITINLITAGEDTRVSNVKRLKSIRDDWPGWMNRNTKKDDNNNSSISCLKKNNKLFTRVSQSSEKAAFKLGRGLTSPILIIDEAAYIEHIQKTLTAAAGGTRAARELAEKQGQPFCTIMLTTAGNANTRDGKFVHGLWQDAAVWDESYYDCKNRQEVITRMIKNSKATSSPMMNLTLSHTQLGVSDEKIAADIEAAKGTLADINMDYLNIWETGSDDTLIPKDVASEMNRNRRDVVKTEVSAENFVTKWYKEYDPNTMYVIGLDLSDAMGRDDVAWVVMDAYTGEVCSTATFNSVNLIEIMEWIGRHMIEYPNTVLIPENKLNGQTVIDFLTNKLSNHGFDPFKRIFSYIVQGESKVPQDKQDYVFNNAGGVFNNKFLDDVKREFGFMTTKNTRHTLFTDVLQTASRKMSKVIWDGTIIDQLLGLRVKNGRIDHSNDMHDDMAVAWLLGQWFLRHGKNLSHYGIDPLRALREVDDGEVKCPVQMLNDAIQRKSSDRLKVLTEALEATDDEESRMLLEGEVTAMRGRIDMTREEAETTDAIIQKAKEAHRDRYPDRQYDGRNTAELLLNQYRDIY